MSFIYLIFFSILSFNNKLVENLIDFFSLGYLDLIARE